jgi:arginine-tRNA-protein transferase
MSIIPPGLSRHLHFFLSGPMPCPYLPGQVERKLFTRLPSPHATNTEVNSSLTRAGFRRSQDVVYRPACNDCNACIPVRVSVRHYVPSRSQKRVAAKNRDLTVEIVRAAPTDEAYALFLEYQTVRHADGEMARMTAGDFHAMLTEGHASTYFHQLRDADGVLTGVLIADHTGDGYSAVYSFFRPDMPKRSLGLHLIHSLIRTAQDNTVPYVYLGYWIEASRKMSYKAGFRPLQFLSPHGWEWKI